MVVLQEGRVIEDGSPNQLITNNVASQKCCVLFRVSTHQSG